MFEWIQYTGSEEQLADMRNARNGFIYRDMDGFESSILIYHYGSLKRTDSNEVLLIDALFDHIFKGYFNRGRTRDYLVCSPHPLADMIIRQAKTGQPVYWRYRNHKEIRNMTAAPDWNIPGAEYSFTPFDDN